jgi:hypothetical protein
MGANPFLSAKSDEEVEQLVEDAAAAVRGGDGPPADQSRDAGDDLEAEDSDEFFDEAEDAEDGEDPFLGDEEEDADEDEEPAVESKTTPETVPYKRLVKELKKRTELQGQLKEAQSLSAAVIEAYKDYANPVKQLTHDAKFMDALEQLSSKGIPGLDVVVKAVSHFMETGEVLKVEGQNQQPAAPAKPQRDERIDAIIERDAARVVDSTLPAGMRASFRNVAKDYILANADDLSRLGADEVKSLTKAFIKEKGFAKEDIYASAAAAAPEAKKPATSSGRSKPAAGPAKGTAKKGEERQAPKSIDEWEATHNDRIEAFLGERNLS